MKGNFNSVVTPVSPQFFLASAYSKGVHPNCTNPNLRANTSERTTKTERVWQVPFRSKEPVVHTGSVDLGSGAGAVVITQSDTSPQQKFQFLRGPGRRKSVAVPALLPRWTHVPDPIRAPAGLFQSPQLPGLPEDKNISPGLAGVFSAKKPERTNAPGARAISAERTKQCERAMIPEECHQG